MAARTPSERPNFQTRPKHTQRELYARAPYSEKEAAESESVFRHKREKQRFSSNVHLRCDFLLLEWRATLKRLFLKSVRARFFFD